MQSNNPWKAAAAAVSTALLALSMPASAAFIHIDDSDLSNITITAGDFERGFSVNGTELTSGLGNSASITLADGLLHTIGGTWDDNGLADNVRLDLLFALAGDPDFATSGIEFLATTAGGFATLSGTIGGFLDSSLYFSTTVTTLLQDGQTGGGAVPFLTVLFTSEVPPTSVPTPGTLALVGLGGALLALRRRTQR